MRDELIQRSLKWDKALSEAMSSGKEKGEFTCPLCGEKAKYEIYPHPWPWNKHAKGIAAYCENRCVNMMT